mmetsp:Transcript_67657/g.107392  ORF Transcript_67657/g.107392 Transcript_67657/m.107392 type:complete len:116 (-) Transcript_67657:94-441(-)
MSSSLCIVKARQIRRITCRDANYVGFYWSILSLDYEHISLPCNISIRFALSCPQIPEWHIACKACIEIESEQQSKQVLEKEIGWKWFKSHTINQRLQHLSCLSFACDMLSITYSS